MKDYAIRCELRKGAVHTITCLHTLLQTLVFMSVCVARTCEAEVLDEHALNLHGQSNESMDISLGSSTQVSASSSNGRSSITTTSTSASVACMGANVCSCLLFIVACCALLPSLPSCSHLLLPPYGSLSPRLLPVTSALPPPYRRRKGATTQ